MFTTKTVTGKIIKLTIYNGLLLRNTQLYINNHGRKTMPTHKYYYIRYLPKANVDYRVLFALAALAEYDTVNKSYSIIKYHSID